MSSDPSWVSSAHKSTLAEKVAAARASVLGTRAALTPQEIIAILSHSSMSPASGQTGMTASRLEFASVVADTSSQIALALATLQTESGKEESEEVRRAAGAVGQLADSILREVNRPTIRSEPLERRLKALIGEQPDTPRSEETAVGRLALAVFPVMPATKIMITSPGEGRRLQLLGIIRANAHAMWTAYTAVQGQLSQGDAEKANSLMLGLERDVPEFRSLLLQARVDPEEIYEPQWSIKSITGEGADSDLSLGDLFDLISELVDSARRARVSEVGELRAIRDEAKVLEAHLKKIVTEAGKSGLTSYPAVLLQQADVLTGIRKIHAGISQLAQLAGE